MTDSTTSAAVPPPSAPSTLSLQSYLTIVRRRGWLIVVIAVLSTIFGMLPALIGPSTYASTASVRVAALDREGVFRTESGDTDLSTERVIDLLTEVEILGSKRTRSNVQERLPEPAPSFENPDVELLSFTEIIEITVRAGDPDVAAEVANLYADIFIEDRRNRSVEALVSKADELREQSTQATQELEAIAQQLADGTVGANQAASLQLRQANLSAQILDYNRRADELGVEASLRGRGTELVSPAEPGSSPVSDSPVRGGLIGLTLGLLFGLAIAVVIDTIQDRVSSSDDLAAVRPGVSVLATVPHADFDGPGPPTFAVQEAYRYLRTGVRIFGLNAELRSVLVTSAVGDEGKSTTAEFLARTMADAGDRVVLLDCDLRRPSLHARFGLSNEVGLSTLTLGDALLDEVTHFVNDNLAVVPAGPTVQNPGDVLGSERFAEVVAALREQADFVIFDSPPVLPVADALIAGQLTDGALVVGRVGGVRRRAVRQLLHRLDEAGIPVVGLVANDVSEPTGYGYYDAGAARPAPATART